MKKFFTPIILPLFLLLSFSSTAQTFSSPIFPTGGPSGPTSKLLVVNGNPAIVYYDAGDLKYIRSIDTYGTAWGTPVTLEAVGDVGQSFSIQIINGNPAVSFYDATNGDLKFVRSIDASGTSWGTPVLVDAAGIVGGTNSLELINGNPAIAYFDATKMGLKYVRSLDASGTTWGTPVTIEAGRVSVTGDLKLVNGNPAITFNYDVLEDVNRNPIDQARIKYVRANDPSGSAWGTSITIDTFRNSIGIGSMQIVNGNPAIAYTYNGDGVPYIEYVRASDASGSVWSTHISITANAYRAITPSMQIINGKPAIAYFDFYYRQIPGVNNDLKYVASNDASGMAWGTPIIVDAPGEVGITPSLQEVIGSPAISYYDRTNGKIKYIGPPPPATTTTTITSSLNPSTFGQSVTFTATVSTATGTPTGTVTFFDGATNIGSGTLSGKAATFATTVLITGSHNITATYNGDATHSTSTSPILVQVVNAAPPATTTTTVTSSLNPSTFGQSVTFTATVSTASGTPTGSVTFFDGATNIGTGTLAGNAATFSTTTLATDSHSITANYAGNANYAASTSPAITQTVNAALPATTTTTITSSLNPSTFGQSVTFTATVSTTSGTPTGTITFFDGATNIGSATLFGNTATFSKTTLATGSHSITATYNASTSPVLTQIINVTSAAGFNIYPDPVTKGIINLKFTSMPPGNYMIRILNNLGQIVFTKQINNASGNHTETILLGQSIKGIYYLELIKPDNTSDTKKIVVL